MNLQVLIMAVVSKTDLSLKIPNYLKFVQKMNLNVRSFPSSQNIFHDQKDFEYCEIDTDSTYMAISGSSLEEVTKHEMRERYQQGLTGFCTNTDIEADAVYHWFPRTFCTKRAKFNKRTPGLFKLEYNVRK